MSENPRAITTVSCIVPTLGRPALTCRVLEMLASQTRPPDEVVVMSQTDDGREMTYPKPDDAPFQLGVLHDKPIGHPAARNRAAQATRGDLPIHMDDDIEFASDFVQSYLDIFNSEPSIDVVHGGVRLATEPTLSETRMYRDGMDAVQALTASPNWNRRSMALWMASGNMATRRDWFFRVGGFDQRLMAKGADFDIGIRLFLAGAIMVYDPRPYIVHLKHPEGGVRALNVDQHVAWSYVYRKHFRRDAVMGLLASRLYSMLSIRGRQWWRPLALPAAVWRLTRAYRTATRMLDAGPIYVTDPRATTLTTSRELTELARA